MHMLQQGALPPEALETMCNQLPLDFQVRLTRHAQGLNEVHAVQHAQAPPAATKGIKEPCPSPSGNGANGEPHGPEGVEAPSTNDKNGQPRAAAHTAPPSI